MSPPVRTVAGSSPPITNVRTYVYPAQGQSPEQLERDRYECYLSAVQQTGVDPSRPVRAYDQVVVAPAPGTGTATGAVGGAILGSLLAGPRTAGLGLLLLATGAIVGSAADAHRAAEFRRANRACLSARGYPVS